MDKNFTAYSAYYDLLYADKNYVAEADYVMQLLRSLDPTIKNILEYGCGTGNHAEYLCSRDFNVTGIERSAAMVELAKKKSIRNFEPLVADISGYKLDKQFDAVTALFHVISYLTSNEDLRNCFKATYQHLKPGGFFVFDVWYLPAVFNQKPLPRIKKLNNELIEVTRFAEPVWHTEQNTIDVNYDILITDKQTQRAEKLNEKHPMRYFSIPEIELLANQTGFSFIKAEEFLSGNKPSEETWGVCFILQKRSNA